MYTHPISLLFFPLLSILPVALAQSTTIAASPSASTTARTNPGAGNYAYAGCYNETTLIAGTSGARALAQGKMEANDTMTVATCLAFCGTRYAGLEYGRECWCSENLSALSNKLPDTNCSIPCQGNNSEVCGGALTLTLYNRTGTGATSEGAAGWRTAGAMTYVCALGVAVLLGVVL
ncbi:WSC domain-containing protein [Cryomyces antarcticus]